MKNGCIFLISARKHILKKCLTLLDENYNCKFNYPILIFYHGDKYDDNNFRESIEKINEKVKVSFHKIIPKIPSHLKKQDMFWNLKTNGYARKFGIERLGYLHANYFWNNFMNFDELKKFEYMIRIDDDSWFKEKIDFDMFEELDKSGKLCGTAYSWNHIGSRVLETRENFYQWIQDHAKNFNLDIKNKNLEKYLKEGENKKYNNRLKYNENFHSMKYLAGNCNIYNRKMFETEEWKNYLSEFNKIAGGYRYRWGDCEVISMFYYLYLGEEFLDLNLKEKGLYHNKIPDFGGMVFNDV